MYPKTNISALEKESNWWYEIRKSLVIKQIQPFLKDTAYILDAGAGFGDVSFVLKNMGLAVRCLDISLESVKELRERGLIADKGDVQNLPYDNHTFDIILSLDVLEHVKDDLTAIKELKRVLKNDGIAIINVPMFPFLWSFHDEANNHFRRYKRHEIEDKINKCGLTILKQFYWNSILLIPVFVFRKLKMALRIKTDDNADSNNIFISYFSKKILKFDVFLAQKGVFPFGISKMMIVQKNTSKK